LQNNQLLVAEINIKTRVPRPHIYNTSNNARALQWEKKITHLVIVSPGRDVTPKLSDLTVILIAPVPPLTTSILIVRCLQNLTVVNLSIPRAGPGLGRAKKTQVFSG
jgi:hypothetical protein